VTTAAADAPAGTVVLARRLKRRLGAGRRALLRRWRLFEYRLFRLLPLRSDLAVYAAYWYRGYACNPRAIYEKARELTPDVQGVWVVSRAGRIPPGIDHVVAGTRAYYLLLARARYFVNNVGFPDHWVKRDGSVLVHTHHGTPLKRMGLDQLDRSAPGADRVLARHLRRWARWDFSLSSNALSTQVWERVYPGSYTTLEYGYPRNDRLVDSTDADVAAIRARLGLPAGSRVILYAPTHREYETTPRMLLDAARLAQALGDDWVVLSRAHYYFDKGQPITAVAEGRVVDVTSYDVVEDLQVAADVLVTDYSSIMFDFAVLDRPIVIYAPDWDTYQRLRGTYFDLMTEAPGVVCRTEDEVASAFVSGAYADDVATKARQIFRRRFAAWDDGKAAERVVRRVFLGERPELPAGRAA
jgi:CDP-glycerol glycerophosphotransferase